MPRPKIGLNKKEIQKAKSDFKKLQKLINGRPWEDIINDVRISVMNYDLDLFDVNWLGIACTVHRLKGNFWNYGMVSPNIDVWIGDNMYQLKVEEEQK